MFIVIELVYYVFRIFDFIKMVRWVYFELELNIIINIYICVFFEFIIYNDKI